MKRLLNEMENAETAHISIKIPNFGTAYITAPAEYYYDERDDSLSIGDDDAGIVLGNFKENFEVNYDDGFDFFVLNGKSSEVVLYF